MSGAMMRGVADAMLEGRAAGAEGVAAHNAAEAAHARRMHKQSVAHASDLDAQWRAHSNKLEELVKSRTAQASAALVVINAVLQFMQDEMTPDQRNRFRESVARSARARMAELDTQGSGDPTRTSVVNAFSKLPQNQVLGIV